MKTITGNWANLAPDLLHLILTKFSDTFDICDYIRLRTVCKSWHCSINVSDLPPQFPWILKLSDNNKGSFMHFYSIASKKVYIMRAPNSSNNSFGLTSMLVRQFGSDNQFSLVRCKQSCHEFREGYCSFLNPVNNSEVYLPVVHDPEPSGFRFCWSGPRSFYIEDCVIFSYGTNRLAVCKSDGDKLNCIGGDLGYNHAFLNGLLFTIDYWKPEFTRVVDISTCQDAYVIPPPDTKIKGIKFLVESFGKILRVRYTHYTRRIRGGNGSEKVHIFSMHRLEFGNGEGKPCWVMVKSIGDQMLFIDFDARQAFSLKASNFAGFNRNSIYFIDSKGHKIYKYDIKTGKTIPVDCPFRGWNGLTWFVPTLKSCSTSMF